LTTAGIADGSYSPPSNVSLSSANTSAIAAAGLAGLAARSPLNSGWTTSQSNLTGDFGSNYAFRTAVASSGYLMLKAPNAIYPSWSNVTSGASILNLGVNESYIYTFSRKPPLQRLGFWSLTAYGENNFLIDNPRDIYALGDRSNITYPSGQSVYGSNASSLDGHFQILVQAADVTPPANWTSNWLPGPSGGGNLSVLLRWYGAEEELLDGTYVYPVVTKQAAIGEANGNGTTGNGTGAVPVPFAGSAVKSIRVSSVGAVAFGTLFMAVLLAWHA